MPRRGLIDVIKEELLTCPICMEEYNSGEHRPLLLPCQHIICASCAQSLVRGTDISCPVDRRVFRVPSSGIQGYTVDKTTQDIQNFVRRFGTLTSKMIKDKFLKCLSCGSNYDESEHVPLLLPCQHSLCSACVQGSRVHCPEDGNSYIVPQVGFPRYNTIRNMMDLLSRTSQQQGSTRSISSQSSRANRHIGTHQRQHANQRRQPSWSDNIGDFDLEESSTQANLTHDTRPRGNYRQPEYARRGSPQSFYFPIISANPRLVSQNMVFNMGDVMHNIERGVQAALRGADMAVQQVQRMAQYRD